MKKLTFMIGFLTFIVALCSIVYELIYSQALTIILGGTVLRYSTTIGLFLFSLGVGSFLFKYFRKSDTKKTFFLVEIILCIIGPFGLFFIIWINSLSHWLVYTHLGSYVILFLSHLPIIIVGILSGLELPLLSQLYKKNKSIYEVIGIDYFGSLAGTLIFALILYPSLGLIKAIIIIGMLNMFVAIFFLLVFVKRSSLTKIIGVLLILFYALALTNLSLIDDKTSSFYLQNMRIQSYWSQGLPVTDVVIEERFNTPYQHIHVYSALTNFGDFQTKERCLGIDTSIQLCDTWGESYHQGLVEVPLSFFSNHSDLNILIIGGGDWVAVNHAQRFNVSIDLVDIDKKFALWAKTNEFLAEFHEGAYTYEKLNIFYDDAYHFLANNHKNYDLILIDLPGVEHDKVLHLYSVEFYSMILRSLAPDGFFVVLKYSDSQFKQQNDILFETVRAAGFKQYISYSSYILVNELQIIVDNFYGFSKKSNLQVTNNKSNYVSKLWGAYEGIKWNKIPATSERPNHVFHPNYDMLISFPKRPFPDIY